ncbi:hypothetical protein OF83DRAFT_276925 [Amylostereum chailletii]|nr:hypothetical protein OF83DRAFT_276925 [Amylostereum chailletii]
MSHQQARRTATASARLPSSQQCRGYRTQAPDHHPLRASGPRQSRKVRKSKPDAVQKRSFFGLGEILQVVTNPAETLRSLTESRRLLEEARREIEENRERAQLRPSHTFSRLPGFFPRPAELQAVERTLQEEPCFTVLFGASSVGKTALLRQLLTSNNYHVLHFDLRIAGFADLDSLYTSLSQQMEQYFAFIAKTEGYEDFEKEAWGFKHDRISVEQRINNSNGTGMVRTSDIARLMELFQSSLLKYREFLPSFEANENGKANAEPETTSAPISSQSKRKWWPFNLSKKGRSKKGQEAAKEPEKPKERPPKKMPVFFLDEAHKLPGLIKSVEAMKCLLDSMLVLTKQDRLCHVIHATSDPFYQTWLRQLNVMQHCKILTIGDCSKLETRTYYERRLVPRVPENIRRGLDFEQLYEAFGGRLVHLQDYITDYVNSGGRMEIHQSSHFIQAHALLNLHIIHSSHLAGTEPASRPRSRRNSAAPGIRQSIVNPGESAPGGTGFPIYTPLTGPPRNPHTSTTSAPAEPGYTSDFTALQLLRVMSRLTQPGTRTLSYFMLCREFGVRAVDGMVRGRILDLRWMDPVTREDADTETGNPQQRVPMGQTPRYTRGDTEASRRISRQVGVNRAASTSGTVIAGEFVDVEMDPGAFRPGEEMMHDDEEMFGPKLLPATPILRYAMGSVVAEYEDTTSVSEYASLSDVDEY